MVRPLRKWPPPDDGSWAAMMERLRRRGKIGRIVQSNLEAGTAPAAASDGESPRSSEVTPSTGGGLLSAASAMGSFATRPASSIANGDAAQEVGGVCGHPPARKTAPLQWGSPQRWADGSGVLRTLCQQYSVVKERSNEKWRYVAFHGPHALGASETLAEAQAQCQKEAG